MTAKIFIDGEHGTTGLQIRERLAGRTDLEILSLAHDQRRNDDARQTLLREADIAILCLPDDAARQSVAMAEGSGTRFIDASTAHRSHPDWVFGFAEMTKGQGRAIANAEFVSNPGCYSTGAIALIRPLIEQAIILPDHPLFVQGVSGYSGGGKGLIAQMENPKHAEAISAPHFAYGLGLAHKHVPEIVNRCGLARRPLFTPQVGRYERGMLVQLPLMVDQLNGDAGASDVSSALLHHYQGSQWVEVCSLEPDQVPTRLDATEMVGSDAMRIYVFHDADNAQVLCIASLDNLGKGASGAAIQNLDLMLGSQGSI